MMIHRYWTGDATPPLDPWALDVLCSTQQHAEVTDWTDETLPQALVELLDTVNDQVRPEDVPRHRANVVRLWLLHQYGGWWTDHDFIPLVSYETLPFPATAAHRGGERCGCWVGFPAGHPALALGLKIIATAPPSNERSRDVSGDGFLNRIAGDDVVRMKLYIDVDGRMNDGATPWGIHAHNTSARRRRE